MVGRAGGSCGASRPRCSRPPPAGPRPPRPHPDPPARPPPAARARALAGRQLSSPSRTALDTRASHDHSRRFRSNTSYTSDARGKPLRLNHQNSFASGDALEPIRRPRWRWRPGRGPARLPARTRTEHAEPRREHAVEQPARQSPRLRAAARRQGQEIAEHDRVCSSAVFRTRRRNRWKTRLQDQSSPRKDQHVHQDAGARRGAGVRGDGAQGGRGACQARDPLRRRALLTDPRVTQVRRRAAAARRRARPRYGAGARALPRRGARGRPQGRHHQAHPAHHAHVHSDAVARARASVRSDGAARERGGGAQGDRGTHRTAHGRGGRAGRFRGNRAASAAVPRRHRLAAAARAGSRLLVGRLVLVGRVVRPAGRPAGHLVVDGARRGAGRVAVVRVAERVGRRRVGVGPRAAVAGGVPGARVRRVRRARRGGGAGAVRPQPVLPGVRAAPGGGGRAVPRLLGAGALRHPHPLVRRERPTADLV